MTPPRYSTGPLSLVIFAYWCWNYHGVRGWVPSPRCASTFPRSSARQQRQRHPHVVVLMSTPFELGYYEERPDDPFDPNASPLARPPDTKLVLGLNKYSHDTSLCAANAETGQVLFAMSKERLSRKKHDGGNMVQLVETCLETLDLDYDSIQSVVMNNHHHRILPLERDRAHMEWESGLGINGGAEDGYEEDENVLPDAQTRVELSHHLAHAYSTATQAPFDKGMVVVMDGMGETYRTMLRAEVTNDTTYISDWTFGSDTFQCIPSDLKEQSQISYFDWREAESVYVFEKVRPNAIALKPVFKRFTPENSPPTLYNHGFENMESAGALYSRASSHIFGDWNACGKVMGLAPWMGSSWRTSNKSQNLDDKNNAENNFLPPLIQPKEETRRIMWGSLYSENEGEAFQIDKHVIAGQPLITRMDTDLFNANENMMATQRYDFDEDEDDDHEGTKSSNAKGEAKRLPTRVALDAIALAHRIQVDLEDVVMDFVKHFKHETQQQNLCIAGGVGLNSVLNGRLSRELGFVNTFISPYPGDDGIAVGCCAFGLFGNQILESQGKISKEVINSHRPPVWDAPLSPYTGPSYSESTIKDAIDEAEPWLDIEVVRDEATRLELVAQEIASGGVVAWYHGRSEIGPRALGHRSILADPRKKGLVRFINQHVKKRESFRPFAPSALAEHAAEWFDLGDVDSSSASPYMSLTAMVHQDKRSLIPAVTHVDGSSRLQTVTKEAEPLYHKLISKFFELTGVPMVLNTSFNTLPGEPIVETPQNAIRSFLCAMGAIEMLVMGDYVLKRKKANLKSLLGEVDRKGQTVLQEPACPRRSGPATFQTTFEAAEGSMEEENVLTTTKVRMPARPMHHSKAEWFEVMDELEGELLSICDGSVSINDMVTQFMVSEEESDEDGNESNKQHEDATMLVQNFVHRLVRLYEHTLISW